MVTIAVRDSFQQQWEERLHMYVMAEVYRKEVMSHKKRHT